MWEIKLSIVAHHFKPNNQEVEAGMFLCVQSQPVRHSSSPILPSQWVPGVSGQHETVPQEIIKRTLKNIKVQYYMGS